MSSAIVVDLGSSAVKCGLANSYLTDTQPSVVTFFCRNMCGNAGPWRISGCRRQRTAWVVVQVTSTSLRTTSAKDGTPLDGGVQAVKDGQVADWGALERILHDALYMQVGHPPLLSCEELLQTDPANPVMQRRHGVDVSLVPHAASSWAGRWGRRATC